MRKAKKRLQPRETQQHTHNKPIHPIDLYEVINETILNKTSICSKIISFLQTQTLIKQLKNNMLHTFIFQT